MKIEHDDKLEKNDLAEGLKSIVGRAKSGQFVNVRFVVLLVLLAAVAGVWWYLRGSNRRSEADMWRTFDGLATGEQFEEFAKGHANTPAGRAARLQQARAVLAEGLQKLTAPAETDDARKKTVEAIETARELFAKLADEYRDDLTLKAQALDGAAKAELALVGVPKAGTADDSRGSVKKAAEFYRDYAKTVGEATPPGEAAAKKAADLEANAATVLDLGKELNKKFSPQLKVDEPKAPGPWAPEAPKTQPPEPAAPTGKIETPPPPPMLPPTPPAKVPSGK